MLPLYRHLFFVQSPLVLDSYGMLPEILLRLFLVCAREFLELLSQADTFLSEFLKGLSRFTGLFEAVGDVSPFFVILVHLHERALAAMKPKLGIVSTA